MSKNYYLIKFEDKQQYDLNKDKLVASNEYDIIVTKNHFWVVHYLTNEEYEKIKSYGFNISIDDELITVKS
jgi:hypothetical protein